LKNDIIKDYIIHNGQTVRVDEFDYTETKKTPGIYEVIRIIDGVPLFMERHLSRFKSSSRLLGFQLQLNDDVLIKYIKELIKINNCKYGNVKIIINNLDNPVQDNYVFFMKSSYPAQSQIDNGVPVVLYYGERSNPNAKSTELSMREKVNQEISSHGAYEALLVNKNNEITEGSRSNVFFVKDNTVYTSPSKNVLQGVTRGYILEICENLDIKVIETPVNVDFLSEADGLFITGTSPQVLPVSCVDNIKFSSAGNGIVRQIREAYENLVQEYVITNK